MPRIAIFASGNGTNAENICRYFQKNDTIEIAGLFCNKPKARVIKRLKAFDIPVNLFNRADCYENGQLLKLLNKTKPDLIVLAGFLWLVPKEIVTAFPNRIVNVHPALLPKYGGKGMYGSKVHQAVKENGESETGITIHYVNEEYDEGNIVFQASCPVENADTIEDIAHKVHLLEHKHFPEVIENLLLGN